MSNYTQIYGILNDAVSDVLGNQAPRVKDTTSFVDLGRAMADANMYDAFYGALACRISKTVAFVRLYERNNRRVITDAQEFGAYVQKIYTELPADVADPTWSVSNGQNPPTISTANPYDVSTIVNISAKIYGKKGVWAIEVKFPTKQIKEAFLSAEAMGAFIDSLYTTIETRMNLDMEQTETLAVATSIANSVENGQSTNLLQVYNQEFGKTLQVSMALNDVSFLAYASEKITRMSKNMKRMSKVFNAASYPTFTPDDKLVVEVLSEFASKAQFLLHSNTFHEELVKLPGYNEIDYWQGSGTGFAFADTSTIKIKNVDIKNNGATPPVAVEVAQSGILAFLRDEENVKAYYSDRETWEMPNPRERTIVHGEQAEKGFAVDPHANAWVFYIADVD